MNGTRAGSKFEAVVQIGDFGIEERLGAGGETRHHYEGNLQDNLQDLSDRLQRGAY